MESQNEETYIGEIDLMIGILKDGSGEMNIREILSDIE